MSEDTGSVTDTGNPPTDQPPTEGAFSWADALGDSHAEYEGLLQTKGWKGPGDALKSYAELERYVGTDRIAVPKPGDNDAFRTVMEKLGAPKEAAGYEFKKPDGLPDGFYDDDFASFARDMAHKANLTGQQARVMHDEWVAKSLESVQAAEDAQAKRAETEAAALDKALRDDWGGDYDQKVELSRRAAKHFATEADADALEKAIGSTAMLKMFAKIGEHFGEDDLLGQGDNEFAATEAGARGEIGRLKLDPEFMKALSTAEHVGHADAKAKWRKLHEVGYPGVVGG